jgi:hypothetical protein
MTEEKKEPMLKIELDELTSVPKVFYNGEEVTAKIRVYFEWKTKDVNVKQDSPMIHIEYFPKNSRGISEAIHFNGKPLEENVVTSEFNA